MFKKLFFSFFLLFFILVAFAPSALADCNCTCNGTTYTTVAISATTCASACIAMSGTFNSCNPILPADGEDFDPADNGAANDDSIKLRNPLSTIDSPQQLIGNIINAVLGVVGSIALLMFVYGGLIWMTSAGSAEKIKQGKDIIVWSAIGLAIIFFAYGMVRILLINLK